MLSAVVPLLHATGCLPARLTSLATCCRNLLLPLLLQTLRPLLLLLQLLQLVRLLLLLLPAHRRSRRLPIRPLLGLGRERRLCPRVLLLLAPQLPLLRSLGTKALGLLLTQELMRHRAVQQTNPLPAVSDCSDAGQRAAWKCTHSGRPAAAQAIPIITTPASAILTTTASTRPPGVTTQPNASATIRTCTSPGAIATRPAEAFPEGIEALPGPLA